MRLEWIDKPGILAIPDTSDNDDLEKIGAARGWKIFRGSESDVLGRYAGAIRAFNMKKVIRATGDNPFVDAEIFHGVANAIGEYDCASYSGYPYGSGVEGATAAALLDAAANARDKAEREHVMPHLYNHPEKFSRFMLQSSDPCDIRLTVDTDEDLERTRKIIERLGEYPTPVEIKEFLS